MQALNNVIELFRRKPQGKFAEIFRNILRELVLADFQAF